MLLPKGLDGLRNENRLALTVLDKIFVINSPK